MSGIFLLCLACCNQAGPDAVQFARLLGALHSEIQDVEMVCEGRRRTPLVNDPEYGALKERADIDFQAVYAFRSRDGAAYLDSFRKRVHGDQDVLRETQALFDGKVRRQTLSLDDPMRKMPVAAENGGSGSLRFDGSPERFQYLWFWRPFIEDPGLWGYQYEGEEEIAGSRCLRVMIEKHPGIDSPTKRRMRFWIDLTRGGHVLREDCYRGSNLLYRVEEVRLSQFDLPDGKKVWFPVHGEFLTFLKGDQYLDAPSLRETYDVVRGSPVFNQNFGDDRFDVAWRGRKAASTAFEKERRTFEAERQAKPKPKPQRTDPAGVEAEQAARLAEAERQSRELDASPPYSRPWNSRTIGQAGLAAFGAIALFLAFFLRRRA